MVALFDYDSLIYKSCYKIVDYQTIREWFERGKTKDWMRQKIVDKSITRLSNLGDGIFLDMYHSGIEITQVEYYITAPKKSARKEVDPAYKSNRKKNTWVNRIRKHLLDANFAITSDAFEADDMIYDRAMTLEEGERVIVTIDKDLKQIPGIHFDYYRPKVVDQDGNPKSGPCRGIDLVSEDQAERFFWYQMLTGDHGDCIKGVPGIGAKRACKLLDEVATGELQKAVMQSYFKKFDGMDEFVNNYYLLKLGTEDRDLEILYSRLCDEAVM